MTEIFIFRLIIQIITFYKCLIGVSGLLHQKPRKKEGYNRHNQYNLRLAERRESIFDSLDYYAKNPLPHYQKPPLRSVIDNLGF